MVIVLLKYIIDDAKKHAKAKIAKWQAETEEEREDRRLQDAKIKKIKRQAETEEEMEDRRIQDAQAKRAKR